MVKSATWQEEQPILANICRPRVGLSALRGVSRLEEQTFIWLEKAYAQHSNSMMTLRVDPLYDPLRSDSRFQDMLGVPD
jgi:hypothetical protein